MYTGAVGWVRGDGRAVFNVAIRTAIVGRDTVDYHAGGGILWDSNPEAEWEETLTKSREMDTFLRERAEQAVAEHAPVPYLAPAVQRGFGFFETALLVGRRAILWDPHLDRLLRGLGRLELPAPARGAIEAAASAAVDAFAPKPDTQAGLRLTWLAAGRTSRTPGPGVSTPT